ncbi:hypothetical protein BGZ63DRAFT_398542 [Mariannaea sp. PMI_226]|nr:hypothetical protein BGZ63DRAFT_398542 [Mariannaea sp. PMI_226]
MSKVDAADQVKFLVCCIGNTSNGRPDFQAVASELEIVSKAAAQKRYERLLKSYGIKPGGGNVTTNASAKSPPFKNKTTQTTTPRKRKIKEDQASPTPVKRHTRTTRVKKEEVLYDEEFGLEPNSEVDEKKQGTEGFDASPDSPLSSSDQEA